MREGWEGHTHILYSFPRTICRSWQMTCRIFRQVEDIYQDKDCLERHSHDPPMNSPGGGSENNHM